MRIKIIFGFLCFCFGVYAQTPNLNSGLVAYFPFSGNAYDASSNKTQSVVNGARLTEDKFGNKGCAYFFDGLDDHISIINAGAIFPEYTSTVAFWAKAASFKSHNVYFLNTNDQYNRISGEVMYNHNGLNVCFFDHGNIGPGRLSYVQTFDKNWHHYTFQSDYGNNQMKLYIDGILAQATNSSAIFSNVKGVDMWIGGGIYNGSAGLFFHGSIDEFRIYNRVLTQQEIQLLQNFSGCESSLDTTDSNGWSLPCTTDYYQVLPNPAISSFKIKVTQGCSLSGNATLYNALGQLVNTQLFIDNEANFEVHDFASGPYYVRITDASGLILSVKKVIIGI